MPRWRPLGMTADAIKASDGDCVLRFVGRCLLPDDVQSVNAGKQADGSLIDGNVPHALSLDHIFEQANHGPDHRAQNLLTMHRHCNTIRGSRPFVRFVGRDNAIRIAHLIPRVAPTIRRCISQTI